MVDGKPVLKEEVQQALSDGNMDYLLNEVGAGFGGSGNYFFEFVLTNKDNINNFGEARPGRPPTIPLPEVLKLQRIIPM